MSDGADIDRYVKDPSLLVELCREVIDRLDPDSDSDASELGEREAQLQEISKAIERLENAGVSVPDVLRGEKTRLVASLALTADAAQALGQLADEFQSILKDLRDRAAPPLATSLKPRGKYSRLPKTSKKVLREHIIRALKKLRGSARVSDVIEEIGRQLDGKLLSGDTEWRETTNEYAWQNNAKWERYQMTQDGVLRTGSPRGIWELSEDGK
jgi:hypothetical protein